MIQLIIWLVVLLAIFGAFLVLANDNVRRSSRTTEQFERDVAESKGLMRSLTAAGALEMESMISPSKKAAIELKLDERGGRTRTGDKGDDAGRTEVGSDGQE